MHFTHHTFTYAYTKVRQSMHEKEGKLKMKKGAPWFRIYTDIRNNRKLSLIDSDDRWAWLCLLAVAMENDGMIEKDIDNISYDTRISVENVKKAISNLLKVKLLDEDDNHYIPHNWRERQPVSDNQALQKRKWRQRQKETQAKETARQ